MQEFHRFLSVLVKERKSHFRFSQRQMVIKLRFTIIIILLWNHCENVRNLEFKAKKWSWKPPRSSLSDNFSIFFSFFDGFIMYFRLLNTSRVSRKWLSVGHPMLWHEYTQLKLISFVERKCLFMVMIGGLHLNFHPADSSTAVVVDFHIIYALDLVFNTEMTLINCKSFPCFFFLVKAMEK